MLTCPSARKIRDSHTGSRQWGRQAGFPPVSITDNVESALDSWIIWRTHKDDVVEDALPHLAAFPRPASSKLEGVQMASLLVAPIGHNGEGHT